jgi:hypothetical protein
VIVKKYPWEMLHDYPKDIQEAATLAPPTDRQKKNDKVFSVTGAILIFASVIAFGLVQFNNTPTGFLSILFFTFIIVMMWNVIDLLVMDWIIICVITPKWVVIEGTEGCAGYKDYWFHFKGFLIGCIYSTIMALVVSGIDYLILRFVFWR